MEIVTRKEAKERGLKRFFTGKPCKNGHISIRRLPSGSCDGCIKENAAQWYENNTEYKLNKNKENYRKSKNTVLARAKKYWMENRDRYREWNKDWARKNPEKIYDSSLRYKSKNPEKVRSWQRTQRAKRSKAHGSHTESDIINRLKWQNGKCAVCSVPLGDKYEADHYIPLSLGGHNNASNIQILCRTCNRRKHAKDPITFYQKMGFLL